MSRTFNGSTDRLTFSGIPANVTSILFSVCGFGKTTSSTAAQAVTGFSRTSVPFGEEIVLFFSGNVANDPIALLVTATTAVAAVSSTGYSTNTWTVASAANPATNSRTAYINGGSPGNETTTKAPTIAQPETSIGCYTAAGVRSAFFAGDLAEVAWFNVGLSARQNAALGKGACPLLASQGVVAYWPLWPGNTGTEVGLIRGTALAATGTASARHAPVFARHAGGV
jgi:hypothetical protein